MPDPFADVTPGQRVRYSAERENTLNAIARRSQKIGLNGGGGIPFANLSPTVISISLTGDEPIDHGGVVGLNAVIFEPTDGKFIPEVAFEADAPTQENADRRQIAILGVPANPGKGLYTAYMAGIFPAKIDVVSTSHQFARVIAGQSSKLKTHLSYGEYRILTPLAGTGDQWALVTPAGHFELTAKLTGSAAGGGKYNSRTFGPPTGTPSASGNLAETDLGTIAGADDSIFEPINEVGASTHVWTEDGVTVYGRGSYKGTTADGKIVVAGIPFPAGGCEETS